MEIHWLALLDTYTGPWTSAEAAHLARRAGFGARPDEIAALAAMGMQAAVDRYVDFPPYDTAMEARLSALPDDDSDLGRIKKPYALPHLNGYWMYRMVHATHPLMEQLALFFHNMLVSEFDKVNFGIPKNIFHGNDGSKSGQACTGGSIAPDSWNHDRKGCELMLAQNHLFRTDGPGPYRQLLRKITRNPAMLLYLDNYTNVFGVAQENYAREVLELFSLGVGNYTEEDVRAVARAFTGETLDRSCESDWSMRYTFDRTKHDFNPKTAFGYTFYSGTEPDTDTVISVVLGHVSHADITPYHSIYPAASIFVPWKMLKWFLIDSLPMNHAVVGEAAQHFLTTFAQGEVYSIREFLRRLFKSKIFYDPQYRFKMHKTPADFMAMALRNLRLGETSWSSGVHAYLRDMGMILFQPPSVAGWAHGSAWISSSSLVARFNYGDRLSGASIMTDAHVDGLLSGGVFANGNAHATMIEYFRARLLQDTLSPAETAALNNFLNTIGDAANNLSRYRRKVRGLAHLFMAMPRFQLK